MSLPVPLSIRLKTSTRDVHITDEVDDLVFGSTSPGGFDTATLSLHRPLRFMPAEVAQFGRLYVYDARNGNTVWEGRLQDPGRSAGTDGETYALAAVGGQAHLSDDTRMLYYVDTDPTHWAKTDPGGTRAAQVDQNSDANASGDPSLVLRIPQGTGVDGSIPSRVVAAHRGISAAGQKLARIAFSWDTGLTSANLVLSLYAGTYGLGPADIPFTTTFNIAGGTVGRIVDPGAGSAAWSNGRNWPLLRFHYTVAGAATVNADSWWLEITNLVVRTMMYAADGTEITDYSSATNLRYADNFVYADQVVADLLGRILTATVDGATATIATTTHHIDHLAYPDGVTPAAVLEDMIGFEQGFTYHLWESNPATGKFRFEWVPWPTTVRYEADVVDGFDSPASGNSVYSRVAVRYRNRGVTQVTFRTQTAPMLTAAGFDRTAYVDLGDEASSSANADRVGDQFLTEHQVPVNAGRLTVRAPILDIQAGRMVQPWEIRPGTLIRVKGIAPYPNSLNNAGRDGNTVFKVAATSYSSADATATLDLDSYAPSVARALASLVRKPTVRRR
jgi:hypothetical protein